LCLKINTDRPMGKPVTANKNKQAASKKATPAAKAGKKNLAAATPAVAVSPRALRVTYTKGCKWSARAATSVVKRLSTAGYNATGPFAELTERRNIIIATVDGDKTKVFEKQKDGPFRMGTFDLVASRLAKLK
jgi:hypothetical protein